MLNFLHNLAKNLNKYMKYTLPILILIILLVGGAVFFYWYNSQQTTPSVIEPDNDIVGMPNPAAVYCIDEIGGEVMNFENALGVAGYCLLPEGTLCEEWKLFNSNGKDCEAPGSDEFPILPAQ